MSLELKSTEEAFEKVRAGIHQHPELLDSLDAELQKIADDPKGRIRTSQGIPYAVGVRLANFKVEVAGIVRHFNAFVLTDDDSITIYDITCSPPFN